MQGLVKVDHETRSVTVLSTSPTAGGQDFVFADGLDVDQDGNVYFTDASALPPMRSAKGLWDGFETSSIDFMLVVIAHATFPFLVQSDLNITFWVLLELCLPSEKIARYVAS